MENGITNISDYKAGCKERGNRSFRMFLHIGLESIALAKENGSWALLDAIESLVVPNDLKKELANYPGATEFFDALSKSATNHLLYWVVSAKREETRQK